MVNMVGMGGKKKPEMHVVQGASAVIRALMEQQGVNKAELARRVGKSRAYITQSLTGERNMTLGSFARFADALDADPVIDLKPRGHPGRLVPKGSAPRSSDSNRKGQR